MKNGYAIAFAVCCSVLVVCLFLFQSLFLGSTWISVRIKRPTEKASPIIDNAHDACYSSQTAAEIFGPLCRTLKFEFLVSCRYLQVKIVCSKVSIPCKPWTWDVANWTLIYENSGHSIDSTMCSYPVNTSDRVLRIKEANGTMLYPGCSLQKHSCQMPHFDSRLDMRINTDPCCRKNMLEMMRILTGLMDKRDVNHVLISGAVLGWQRDNSLVPYDTDLDFIVDEKDKSKFEEIIEKEFPKYGFSLIVRNGPRWICPHSDCWHVCHLDMWYFSTKQSKIEIYYYVGGGRLWNQPLHNMFPRKLRDLEGYKFWFPAKPVEYLDHEYDNWRKILKCTKKYDQSCTQ